MKYFISLAVSVALTGCASQGELTSKTKAISLDEASAFERSLLARSSFVPKMPEMIYIQPNNKKEACRLPTTQSQLDRYNFRSYWDGECKSGFAFGLGREISISDTHHFEEITVYSEGNKKWSQPRVIYDYLKNSITYKFSGSKFPIETSFREEMDVSASGLNVTHVLGVMDESGNVFGLVTSPFESERTYLMSRVNSIVYKFTDYSAAPAMSQNERDFTFEILDPRNKAAGSVGMVRSKDGFIRHFRFVGGAMEIVRFPVDYENHLKNKYQEVLISLSSAGEALKSAQQIEREYLFKVCNGKGGINGLDGTTYTKICNWHDRFKEPYAAASAKYQKQLERLKQQVATVEQQRQIQQQIALQQQMLQMQQSFQIWKETDQINQQIQQRAQQNMQGMSNWQVPQVQPITPPGGNKIVCQTIGRITTCR